MQRLFFLLGSLVLFCNSAFAGLYKLDFILEVANSKPLKGILVVNEGQPGRITQNDLSIQLVATQEANNTVKINAEIWQVSESGQEKKVGRSTIITRLNGNARISQSTEDTQYSLSVTPTE